MDWTSADNRAEWAMDVAAAAIFAAAVGFAVWAVAIGAGQASVCIVAAFLVAYCGLRQIAADEQTYELPAFSLDAFEPMHGAQSGATGELILEDMLAKVSPDARVVQLFGPSQGQLGSSHSRMAPPDASQALSSALAELRRSLH